MKEVSSAAPATALQGIASDASSKFLPAFKHAEAYAGIFGYKLSFKGGDKVKSMGPQPIQPHQIQDISLTLPSGKTVALGGVLPEAKHLGPVKSEKVLEREITALVDKYRTGLKQTTPFHGDAGSNFHPAIAQASAYAKLHGFKGVTFEGTGINAKSMGPPPVTSTEVQQLFLLDAGGKKHKLGKILPEKDHIKTLKSTPALFDEIRAMIDHQAAKA